MILGCPNGSPTLSIPYAPAPNVLPDAPCNFRQARAVGGVQESVARARLGRDRSVGGLKEDKWIAPPQDAPTILRLENGVALRASKIWTMKGVDTSSRIARFCCRDVWL